FKEQTTPPGASACTSPAPISSCASAGTASHSRPYVRTRPRATPLDMDAPSMRGVRLQGGCPAQLPQSRGERGPHVVGMQTVGGSVAAARASASDGAPPVSAQRCRGAGTPAAVRSEPEVLPTDEERLEVAADPRRE